MWKMRSLVWFHLRIREENVDMSYYSVYENFWKQKISSYFTNEGVKRFSLKTHHLFYSDTVPLRENIEAYEKYMDLRSFRNTCQNVSWLIICKPLKDDYSQYLDNYLNSSANKGEKQTLINWSISVFSSFTLIAVSLFMRMLLCS